MANLWVKCKVGICVLCTVFLINSCSSAPEQKQAPAAPKAKPYEVYTVEIKDMKFVPDSITVNKGDEVVFVNRDMVAHCVTEAASKAWTSGPLPAGESYLLVVKESDNYYCAIHQVMKGKIVMK